MMIGTALLTILFIVGFAGFLIYREKKGADKPETVRVIMYTALGTIFMIIVAVFAMMIKYFK